MSEPAYRRQNDTGPPLKFTTKNPDGSLFDPTGWSLQLQLQLDSLDADLGVWTPGAGVFTIVDGPNGRVDYALDAADTAATGCFRMMVEALNGTDRRTFPQRSYRKLVVTAQNLDQ